MKRLSLLLGLAGVALGTALIGWFGFRHVVEATLSVGVGGFAAVCAWQMVLFGALGLCWFVLAPPAQNWRLWVAVWGRMVRDAAGGLLPFSLVGGFVLGARVVTLHGVSWPVATASTVVDLTTEFIAQIGLVLIGVVILSARTPGSAVTLPVCLGLIAAVLGGFGFIWLQRGGASPFMRLVSRLGRRVLGGLGGNVDGQMAAVQQALTAIYGRPWRVALGTALHLLAWLGTGFASWIAFRLLGADIGYVSALGIEALLHAVLATAILVPGYAGVQEAAYAGVGALFGQPPEMSLAVSLLRRARDVALGVPILAGWQAMEWFRRRRATG
ncbi:MAG: lysylphosphatidylglycerol synthase domain-containing protein [Rhodospirillales bacterium]